ncbi:hypothetical protein PA08_1345 [Cutibacterium modestum P08]|nr:hypothetical protein PA08_1345 [Cutibacterium modestum P08]
MSSTVSLKRHQRLSFLVWQGLGANQAGEPVNSQMMVTVMAF